MLLHYSEETVLRIMIKMENTTSLAVYNGTKQAILTLLSRTQGVVGETAVIAVPFVLLACDT